MRKVLIAIAMIVGIVVVPSVASAHHPLISGTPTCPENGTWSVTWVVEPDVARQDVTWQIVSPSGYSPAGSQVADQPFTRTVTYPESQAVAWEVVTAAWSDGSGGRRAASVTRPADCVVPPDKVGVSLTKRVEGGAAQPGDWELSARGSGGEVSGWGVASGELVPGTYTLAESDGPAGYDPEGWVCRGGSLVGDQLTITAADVDDGVDCSITNTFQDPCPGQVVPVSLSKKVEGGPARPDEWRLSAKGDCGEFSGWGSASGLLVPGRYTLAESEGPAGYDPDGWVCRGGSVVGDRLTITAADARDGVDCSITNRVPTPPIEVSLTKKVDGPAAPDEWLLTASSVPGGEIVLSGRGVASGELVPGTYTLAESGGPVGYQPDPEGWVCRGGRLAGDQLTISAADAADGVDCSITNYYDSEIDVPVEVSLVKRVVGGSATRDAWVVSASGLRERIREGISGRGSVSGLLPPGTYSLAESDGPAGYEPGPWSCDGGSLSGDRLTITAADARDGVDCSITNRYTPVEVSLVKRVVGGSATPGEWLLSASGSGGEISGRGSVSGLVVPGTYTLAESDGPAGYVPDPWKCVGGSVEGDRLTITAADARDGVDCSITNRVPTPPIEVSLTKKVDGPAAPDEWLLSASSVPGGEIVLSGWGVASGELVPGRYTLAESDGPAGYEPEGWVCRGGSLEGDRLTITAADARDGVACSITNTAPSPVEVSLVKRVVGGSARPGEWLLSASGSGGEISGRGSVSGLLVSGTYTLAESGGPDGYVPEGWVCDGELLPDDQLTITAADADAGVDCSITNTNFEVDPDVVCRDGTRPMISYRMTGLDTGAEETVDVTLFDLDNRPVGRFAGRKLNDMVAHPGGAGGASDLLRGGGFLVAEVRGIVSLPAIYGQVPSNCGTPPLVKVWLDCGPVPHVMYKVLEPARGPVTITLPSLSGLETFAGQPLEGRRLYPGASENPNDWPGRRRGPDGAWVVDPSDIQLAEGGVLTASGDGFTTKTTYPALYPPCPPANPPELKLVTPPEFDLIAVDFDPDNPTPGTYTLVPSGPDGYELPVRCDNADGEVTTVTLRAGDDVTCTLEPKELPPSLTIEKRVVNDDGGTAGPDDFVVAAVGYDSTSPQRGGYLLQHVSGPPNYDLTITCDNADGEVTFVTLNPGDDVTCVFAYRAKAPPTTTTTTTTTTIRPVDTAVPVTAEPANARCTGVVAEGDFCVVLDDLADDGDCAESHTYSVYLVNRTDREQDVDVFLIADFVPRSPSFESLVVPLTVPKFSSSADVRPHPISVPIPAGAHRVNARVRVVPEGSGVALEGFETTLRRCDA